MEEEIKAIRNIHEKKIKILILKKKQRPFFFFFYNIDNLSYCNEPFKHAS